MGSKAGVWQGCIPNISEDGRSTWQSWSESSSPVMVGGLNVSLSDFPGGAGERVDLRELCWKKLEQLLCLETWTIRQEKWEVHIPRRSRDTIFVKLSNHVIPRNIHMF